MRRWCAALACAANLAAHAADPAWPTQAGLRLSTSLSLAADAAPAAQAAANYEDKLIDGGSLAPLASDDSQLASYDPAGMPRAWRVEGFGSRIDTGGHVRHENGMVLSARLDTPAYGAISIDGTLRSGGASNVFSLWQRGLAFDDGWRANNGFGMMNTPTINLARQQYRFFLPTFPVAGAQTEWLQGSNVQVQASLGEPGLYDGLRVAGFSRLGGVVATGGVQVALAPEWQAGVQFADARAVQTGLDANDAKTTGRSWYGAAAWRAANDGVQINLIDSQKNDGRHNLGWWVDGETRLGRYRNNYGVFRFDRDLSWGYAPINSDSQGGYWRVNYQSQQWVWAAGLDSVRPVSGPGASGTFVTGNARYQMDRSLGVGGGASARRSGGDAAAAYVFIDKQSTLGATRLQLDVLGAGAQHTQQLAVDHAWPTQPGLRLSTSLTFGHETVANGRVTRASVAAFGGIDLTNTLTIEGNLRFSQERQGGRANGRYANLGLVWRLTPRWSLVATYYDNRAESQPFTGLAALIPVEIAPVIPRDRAIFITVRYEDRAGTPLAPLGGPPGSGAGTVVGYIFYDANDDGRRSAGESGAANVTVVLDGKFATRTDGDGRFEFPMVASGRHTIVVVPDNLALPWAIAGDGRNDVTVLTRQTATLEIAATKMK